MKRDFCQCVVRAALLLSWLVHDGFVAAAERPSVESLIDGLKRSERAFFEPGTLRLRYSRTKSANMARVGQLRRVEWLLGRDGDGWYTEARELDPEERPDLSIPAEPSVFILRGGVSLDWTQHNERVYIASKNNFNVLHGWRYLENAGLNPYRHVIESVGMSYEAAVRDEKPMLRQFLQLPLLPDFLATNATKYRVLADPESIDGNVCWIAEWPGMDKIWFDAAHGHAVRRRVFRWTLGGRVAQQIDNSELREIKPGLWFCFRQVVVSYGRPEAEDGALVNKITNESTYNVTEIDLSRAPDGLTAVRLPVGTMVKDAVRNVEYTVTDDESDPFKRPLGTAADVLGRTRIGLPVFLGAAALFPIIAVVYYLVRRGKRGACILLVLTLIPKAGAQAQLSDAALGGPDERRMVDDKGHWNWKPAWLERNACGPNSLFVLLRLRGKDVTLGQVKNLVKCHPVLGCSMADLSSAASALGVPADVRFVRPDQLADVPFPYILHGTPGLKQRSGHFMVVLGRDEAKRQLASIDPMRESFGWNPENGILSEYSGYILVPKRAPLGRPSILLAIGLSILSGAALTKIFASLPKRGARVSANVDRA